MFTKRHQKTENLSLSLLLVTKVNKLTIEINCALLLI